jgi:hypothetical protein
MKRKNWTNTDAQGLSDTTINQFSCLTQKPLLWPILSNKICWRQPSVMGNYRSGASSEHRVCQAT